jgi:predicted  nucleic acid-binding Zn-ribbon protein
MANVIPDEQMRFRAALAALAPQGFGTKNVIFDIDECLQVLDKKEREAQTASASVRDAAIGSRLKERAALEKTAAELRAELERVSVKTATIISEIAEEERRIQSNEARFAAAVAAFRQELLDKKNSISAL